MSSPIFLSVCIPTYNRVSYLEKCVRSVISQLTDEIEVIIQDNASTDNTWNFLSSIEHVQVHCYSNETNIGLVPNFVEVVKNARGTYLYILTDDDYLLIDGLKDSIAFARESKCMAFKTAFFTFNEVSKTGQHFSLYPKNIFGEGVDLATAARIYHESNIFSGFVFKKELFNETAIRSNISNWYPSLLLMGLAGENIGYLAEPTNVHIWENETYWGISPEKRSELNRGQVEILLYLLHNKFISIEHYLELVKVHFSKWLFEDNEKLIHALPINKQKVIDKFYRSLRKKIQIQRIKGWLKSTFF